MGDNLHKVKEKRAKRMQAYDAGTGDVGTSMP